MISCSFDQSGVPCGHLYDMPCVFSETAEIKLYNLEVNIPTTVSRNTVIIVLGDSITEGKGVNNEKNSYAHLLASYFIENAVKVSGRSNGGIRNLIDNPASEETNGRLASDAKPLNPEYVIVTIGTNDWSIHDTTFSTHLQYLIDYVCDVIGAKLILNHIPMRRGIAGTETDSTDTRVTDAINPLIDAAIADNADKGILCCKFDVATALNFDPSQGQDMSLFVDTAHPNADGYLRMLNQMKIDCPELFN